MQTILMGDIIDSKSYPVDKLAGVMLEFRDNISREYKDLIVGTVIPKVGDEYQCLCVDTLSSIKLIFAIEEYFLKSSLVLRSHFVIVQGNFAGELTSPNGRFSKKLYSAHEELNKKSKNRKQVNLQYSEIFMKDCIEDLFYVVNEIKTSWKMKDLNLVYLMLNEENLDKVATRLGSTKQQIQRKYKRLQIESYLKLKNSIFKLVKKGK